MNKTKIENIPAGSLISYLNGVVRFEGYTVKDGETTILISIGKLKNHPIRMRNGEDSLHVVNMREDIQPWFGV